MIKDRILIRLLVHFVEELSEVQKATLKIIRKGASRGRVAALEEEVGDVLAIIERVSGRRFKNLKSYRLIEMQRVHGSKEEKLKRIIKNIVREEKDLK